MEPFNTFRDIIPVTCNRIEAPNLKIPLYILPANHSCSLQEVVAPISIFKYLMVLKTWLSGTIYLNSGCLEWVLLNFWAPSVPRLYHSSVWVVAVCVLFSSSFLVHVPWFQGKEIWFCEPRQLSCTLDIPQIWTVWVAGQGRCICTTEQRREHSWVRLSLMTYPLGLLEQPWTPFWLDRLVMVFSKQLWM